MARREITGKKSSGANRRRCNIPILAMSIPQFCTAHNISEGFCYKLKKLKLNPARDEGRIAHIDHVRSSQEMARRTREGQHSESRESPRQARAGRLTKMAARPAADKPKSSRVRCGDIRTVSSL